MTQLRRHSAFEAITNTAIGYVIAVVTQAVVFPWFGIRITGEQDVEIAGVFTVVSLVRGYALRRAFNAYDRYRSIRSLCRGRY